MLTFTGTQMAKCSITQGRQSYTDQSHTVARHVVNVPTHRYEEEAFLYPNVPLLYFLSNFWL